ncbi:DUF6879 family protein [Uniformispora flossi]|uniref:DUF6879 family protein n=1 Tax=Uniformispora flossi TaxID=3390723 RepID=UPI003C2B2AE3
MADAFNELFDTFEREAFRLETLDTYSVPSSNPSLHAFLDGHPKPDDYNRAWCSEVQAITQAGKRIYRVHVLSRPLTPYLRFELGWGYRTNATAGEEFHILDTTDQPNPVSAASDFWLFDEATAVTMNYDADGAIVSREILPGDSAADYVALRDTALRHAVPFADWWAKYGE